MPEGLSASPHSARQKWMALLARALRSELEEAWAGLPEGVSYTHMRRSECGLVMVRGRAGGTGDPFNLGEMTVARCVVRLDDPSNTIGHAYIAGRDLRHAELAAAFDAIFQLRSESDAIEAPLLNTIRARLNRQQREKAAEVAATRVDFFTMVREQGSD